MKYAIRKLGWSHAILRHTAERGGVPVFFRKAVLTAWDKINLKESV